MVGDHSFNVECATRWGVGEAVMLHHLTYWVAKNSANGRHIHDRRAWTYNTYTAFQTLHPYWSKSQVARLLTKLEELGCIASSQMLKGEWNRVKWYTILPPVRQVYGIPDYDVADPVASKTRNRDIDSTGPSVLPTTVKRQQIEVRPQVVMPWLDDGFQQLWEEWKIDRKERGIKPYTVRGEQAALTKLSNDSEGSVGVAIQMIQNSIANGWQGLFKIKADTPHHVRGGVGTTGVDIDRLKSWASSGES